MRHFYWYFVLFTAIRYAPGRGRGFNSGTIATVGGYGAYTNLAQPQVIINPTQPGVQYATSKIMNQMFCFFCFVFT